MEPRAIAGACLLIAIVAWGVIAALIVNSKIENDETKTKDPLGD